MDNQKKGLLLVSIGALFWGGSGVAGQYILHDKSFSPDWLVCMRMLTAGFILLTIDALKSRGGTFSVWRDKRDAALLVTFGIFGMMGAQYTYFLSIYYGNAAAASILQFTMPILIVFWTALASQRLPRFKELFCVALALIGTFLLVTHGRTDALAIPLPAVLWGIASAFAAAFYVISPKGLLLKYRSPLIIGWSMFLGGLFLIPIADPLHFRGTLDASALLAFLYVIIFGTVVAFWSYLESIKYISATMTGTLAALEPLAAVVLSVFLLGMSFGIIELLGAAFILAAVTILARK
ncbi:EamA family transporter [Selenomonas sp. TAMA-11512]|uniref:DMT family transporter n=1 Tax=Selenomonas sp. TAMA-11512 TaxID=3095337 RepID=UPI0030891AE7|nr:EamA family transporter [Selenomonas sp. TAMA-11512]